MNEKEKQKQEQDKVMQAITSMGYQLYNLLAPGMTVTLEIPKSKIAIPGEPMNAGGRLIITKPKFILDAKRQGV